MLLRQLIGILLPMSLLSRIRPFSSFVASSAMLKNLDASQSLLICQDKQIAYFQNYCTKALPKRLMPVLVPMSLASTCGYKEQEVQTAFSPLQDFILACEGSKCPYNYSQNILFSPSTTSTQTILEEYYSKCEQNLIYFAASMTHGKGRGQNKWESHSGGLMFSYTSKGKLADSVYLPYLDSLCLIKAIKPYVPDVMIKWPNDIIIRGKKIAGIICNAAGNLSKSENCSMVHGIFIYNVLFRYWNKFLE